MVTEPETAHRVNRYFLDELPIKGRPAGCRRRVSLREKSNGYLVRGSAGLDGSALPRGLGEAPVLHDLFANAKLFGWGAKTAGRG